MSDPDYQDDRTGDSEDSSQFIISEAVRIYKHKLKMLEDLLAVYRIDVEALGFGPAYHLLALALAEEYVPAFQPSPMPNNPGGRPRKYDYDHLLEVEAKERKGAARLKKDADIRRAIRKNHPEYAELSDADLEQAIRRARESRGISRKKIEELIRRIHSEMPSSKNYSPSK